MSLDVASLKFIHHSKCRHLNRKCRRFPGKADSEIRFLYKTYHFSTKQTAEAKVGVGDSWYVFYLSIKFVFLIVLRFFAVSGLKFLICIPLSTKYSSASLLLDCEFMVKGTKVRMRR